MKEVMKRYMTYMMALLLGSVVAACSSDMTELEQTSNSNAGAIVLNIAGGNLGVDTRADDIADSDKESAVKHLDIMIFNDAELDEDKTLFYCERATVATDDGKVSLGVDIDDIVIGAKYWVYVVANSTHPASLFANITNVDALFDLTQQDYNVHLTASGMQNTPTHFLMDGVAYMGAAEPITKGAITIAEAPITDVVELSVKLRRAAAKVVVKMVASEKIQFANNIEGSTPGYYMRNLPYETRIINDGILRTSDSMETTHESMSPYFKWITDESGNITSVEVTLYVYSHMWETGDSFNHATNLLVDIPAYYNSEVEGVRTLVAHPNNYYQVPLSKEFLFERNHYYEVIANVHAPGAEDFSEPVEVDDLKYSVYPWTEYTIDVGGQVGPEYLKVNLDELKLFNTNIDAESLLFSSSSPVTIAVTDCYYIDKFGIKQTISAATYNISGSTESGSISGNITVRSDMPQNNTIRYFTLVITNQTGQTETVLVEQYPLVYIVNILGHYSYREDFKLDSEAPTTYEYKGSSISTLSMNRYSNGQWSYTYSNNVGRGFWSSKVATMDYDETSSDRYKGRSRIQYYSWGSSNLAPQLGSSTDDPGNARMYHIRITATSADYSLGLPRMVSDGVQNYTADGDDNAKLVSPSFMTASRLGKVDIQNYGSNNLTNNERRYAMARDHCANYVEVDRDGNVYDNWRLPTMSELSIIIELQGTATQSADAIDYLLDADYYMSASGLVFNPGRSNGGNPNESVWAIRCIRDAY